MSNPPVTAVIPVLNGAATIERAVKSALDAGCNFVLVYDDASTDKTSDIVLNMQYKDYRISLTGFQFHTGVNFARNFLVNTARRGLILPLDADDTLCTIAPLVAAWRPETWVYGNHIERTEGSHDVLVKGVAAGSLPRKNITGVTYLFHRDDWKKVGGYDPDFSVCEDYAMQCNLTHNGIKPVYVDTTVYHRYLKPEGNERSMLANEYWTFFRQMARRKYPSVFAGTG